MPHAHQNKNRRTQVSSVQHVPKPAEPRHGGKLAMAVGVTLSMLVIVGLYAASFRYNTTFQEARHIPQRWSILSDRFSQDLEPLKQQLSQFGGLKQALTGALGAKASQAAAFQIMKNKIDAATGTPPAGN